MFPNLRRKSSNASGGSDQQINEESRFPNKFEEYHEINGRYLLHKLFDPWHHAEQVKSFRIHYKSICALLIDMRGRLISASDDASIKIWNIETGECLKTFLGHKHSVTAVVAVDLLGQLVSGSSDKSIKARAIKYQTRIVDFLN